MIRTFRYPLHPTAAQERVLEHWLVLCQRLYNGALEERRDAWKRSKVSVGLYGQQKSLTQIRADDPEYGALPVEVARSALARLDKAFKAFFRRVKAGEKPGFPRFRARDRYDSFSFPFVRLEGDRLHVPKIGAIRLHLYRPLKGKAREVQIRRQGGKWWACVSCELGEAPAKVPVSKAVGIDLGLTTFATLSDGREVDNPRYFKRAEERVSRANRNLARKQRGSNSRAKAKVSLERAHGYVRNQRLDFARKLACTLFAEHELVAYENLDVQTLVQKNDGQFAKSIHDAAWRMFIGALTSKAEGAGTWAVPVNPRGTTQGCSGCGTLVAKTLRDRVHECPRCGLVLGRDHNAALNILALGMSAAPGRGAVQSTRGS